MPGFVALHHALIRAAGRGQPEKVRQALADGADPFFVDKERKSALTRAIEAKNVECVRLLAPVSDVKSVAGETALIRCAHDGWGPGIEIFLPLCDPTEPDDRGRTALSLAVRKAPIEAIRALAGAIDPGVEDDEGRDAVSMLTQRAASGAAQIARLLLDAMDPKAAQESAARAVWASVASPKAKSDDFVSMQACLAARADFSSLPPRRRGASDSPPQMEMGRKIVSWAGRRMERDFGLEAILAQPYFQKPRVLGWIASELDMALESGQGAAASPEGRPATWHGIDALASALPADWPQALRALGEAAKKGARMPRAQIRHERGELAAAVDGAREAIEGDNASAIGAAPRRQRL